MLSDAGFQSIKALGIAESDVPSPDGKKFSFGTGRSQLKPVFIDKIKSDADK